MYVFLKYLMAFLYVAAGINHFWHPGPYIRIVPSWVPAPALMVVISGICEIGLGLLLLHPSTQHFAAYGLVALLIAVFPANVQMMIDYYRQHDSHLWIAVVRLPLQLVLIWWALRYARN